MRNSKAAIFLLLGLILSYAGFLGGIADRNNPVMQGEGAFAFRVGAALPGIICFLIGIGLFLGRRGPSAGSTAIRVSITPAAALFVKQTFQARQYPANAGIRITVSRDPSQPFTVTFDTATTTGRDYAQQIEGVLVLVEKTLAHRMPPVMIDIVDGQFVCRGTHGQAG